MAEAEGTETTRKKRSYLLQSDVPSHSLSQALRIPRAIADHYAYEPVTPLDLAAALEMTPNSGQFRTLCGAAIAYGLTSGGAKSARIELTELGMKIVRPKRENEDSEAKREALLHPSVLGEFLRKYNQSPLPREDIGANVLVTLGVPKDRARDVLSLAIEGAEAVGLIKTIKGKRYIDITSPLVPAAPEEGQEGEPDTVEVETRQLSQDTGKPPTQKMPPIGPRAQSRNRKVFISHGSNTGFVETIKKLLSFGELEPVVCVECASVSQPVPDKVMADMRQCGAAIIHVDAEVVLLDKDANERVVLNPNVLIEIGAAMALYGRRFILLTKDGIRLPSNLQGLYEVRYSGETLDGAATIQLLEAINDMKNHTLPEGPDAQE